MIFDVEHVEKVIEAAVEKIPLVKPAPKDKRQPVKHMLATEQAMRGSNPYLHP